KSLRQRFLFCLCPHCLFLSSLSLLLLTSKWVSYPSVFPSPSVFLFPETSLSSVYPFFCTSSLFSSFSSL
ncbi:hypothetical protein CSUI_010918, partial [Cystoisospora suis]